MDLFYSNVHFDSERRLWQWCSARLRRRWQRDTICPFGILMGLTLSALDYEGEAEEETSRRVKLGGEALTHDRVGELMDTFPADLLDLALFQSDTIQPLNLDDIRARFCRNERLDDITKMTIARETGYGDSWVDEGLHPSSLIAEWSRCFNALKNALKNRLRQETEKLEATKCALLDLVDLPKIHARFREEARVYCVRRTPKDILNLATRAKLLDAYKRFCLTADPAELPEMIWRLISPGVREAIERAGHSTDDVIVDFLSFDADETRDALLQGWQSQRPRLP